MRKTATMLGVCAVLAAAVPGRAQQPDPMTPAPAAAQPMAQPDVDKGMSDAARDYAAKKKALAQQFRRKRQELTGGAEWKTLAPADRKAKLKALQADYKAQQQVLREDYKAQVNAFKAQKKQTQETAPKGTERSEHGRSTWEREPGGDHGGHGMPRR